MSNYGDALKYTEVAANSAGTAVEKYDAHLESIDGKMDQLTAAFEEFSLALINSDLITGAVGLIIKSEVLMAFCILRSASWLLLKLMRYYHLLRSLSPILSN